ncbi:MAG: hypothetical protein K2H35_03015 [Muribaculaceae bacterium]|nr:hypothetical protein [Muribaculaceae bacterium]MDE6559172.1 hypothetical protein [Muribaculaceae bacterium]
MKKDAADSVFQWLYTAYAKIIKTIEKCKTAAEVADNAAGYIYLYKLIPNSIASGRNGNCYEMLESD